MVRLECLEPVAVLWRNVVTNVIAARLPVSTKVSYFNNVCMLCILFLISTPYTYPQ